MIEETFLFLPGVQERTERNLWAQGIVSWDHLLDAKSIIGVAPERLSFWKLRTRQFRALLDTDEGIVRAARLLGSRHAWRMWSLVRDNPRYLDIETTERCHDITVVGVSDGDFYAGFVQGHNLDVHALRRALQDATCLVTFNGSSFDIPILQRALFGALPETVHIDARHVCAQAGLRGGLKRIEEHLCIRRADAVREKDGTDAVMLWHSYRLGDRAALRDLIDYNAADVLNLAPLIERVIPALWLHIRHDEPFPWTELAPLRPYI